ncbi:hypothetical protein IG631_17096 [Alternaria alternata]|nr:hypothetical protein IG631_17096 [Alternaria alternata]
MPDNRNMSEIMRHSERLTNEDDGVVASIPDVPITEQRKPFVNSESSKLQHTGTARANVAPSVESPDGTPGWKEKHSHQTVLQQHCDFFDRDHDGILWPQDTFVGFYRLGYGIILSIVAVFVIHSNFSYPTCSGWLPDPFFRRNFPLRTT